LGLLWSLVSFKWVPRISTLFANFLYLYTSSHQFLLIKISMWMSRWNVGMPSLVKYSIKIISDAGLGMAMFSLGIWNPFYQPVCLSMHGWIQFNLISNAACDNQRCRS
jgi:hypothetical protein